MSKAKSLGKLQKQYRNDFSGGWNAYLGIRQIKDSESPDLSNCDLFGKGGIGNRLGYSQIGTATASYTYGVKGMGALHTSSYHQLCRFVSNNSNVYMETSTDGAAFSTIATYGFVDKNIDVCQAAGNLYTGNGSDAMKQWSGAAWSSTTNGTQGYYPTYFSRRLWVVDDTNPDQLNFSGQYGYTGGNDEVIVDGTTPVTGVEADKLGDFSDTTAGLIRILPGSGLQITGLKVFKAALYVFTNSSIYRISPASAANTFTITLVTNAVGCVSHRSIVQVEEDLFFASDDGVYSLGDVANYTAVRTTNKSAKIDEVFTSLSGANKAKLAAEYFDFKYHLFYSKGGVSNDSCVAYDIRYQAWLPWTNIPANSAVLYEDSDGERGLYFGHPTTSAVYKMYGAADDDGADISSYFTTKSFDEEQPDIQKVYFDHTFVFGAMDGTVTVSTIFNDSEVSGSKSISQQNPVGGMARQPMGMGAMGYVDGGSTTVTNYVGYPLRMRVSKKKFAIQYKISSSGKWQLDGITTTWKPLNHYSFPSSLKI